MAYTITKTDGTTLGTIADGTINTSATSLTLIGRNYSNYGQLMTNNLVALVENFSDTIEPSNPLEGQIYWNKSEKRLRVYNGSTFKTLAKLDSQASAPNTTTAGDMWWDSNEEQLYIYNGTTPYSAAGWILISPLYKKSKGKSGAIPEQIIDSGSTTRDVVSLYLNGTRTAIISSVQFTPLVAISGFATIYHGLTSNSNFNSGQYFITANNSNNLGGYLPAQYLRSDEDDTTTGVLTVQNTGGIELGLSAGGNLTITTSNTHVDLTNTENSGMLRLAATNSIGATNNVLTLSNDTAVGATSARKLTISDSTVSSNATTGALVVTGGVGIGGNVHITGYTHGELVGNVSGTSDMVRSIVPITLGGTGANNVTTAQQNLLLEPGVNVQAYNVELTAITLVGANGLLTRTASGSATARTLVSADTNIAIADGNGIAGNPTLTLNPDAAFSEPTAVTQPDGDSSTKVATTEFVKNVLPESNENIWYVGNPGSGLAANANKPYGTILVARYTQSYQVGTGNGGVYTAYRNVTSSYIKIAGPGINSWAGF